VRSLKGKGVSRLGDADSEIKEREADGPTEAESAKLERGIAREKVF